MPCEGGKCLRYFERRDPVTDIRAHGLLGRESTGRHAQQTLGGARPFMSGRPACESGLKTTWDSAGDMGGSNKSRCSRHWFAGHG